MPYVTIMIANKLGQERGTPNGTSSKVAHKNNWFYRYYFILNGYSSIFCIDLMLPCRAYHTVVDSDSATKEFFNC